MKTPASPEGKTSAREQGDSRLAAEFVGTDNPRHLRALQALTVRPVPREQLDKVAGCANGPDLVAELRRRGLELPCERGCKKDRDLFDCWPGVYFLSQRDRRKLTEWKRRRAAGERQAQARSVTSGAAQ